MNKDIPILDVDYHLREYDDITVRLNNVGGLDEVAELCSEARNVIIKLRKRIIELEQGPGGIMEMKQTIANKEAEIESLKPETKMEWNHRVLKHKGYNGEEYYAIHEVFYSMDGLGTKAWTENPTEIVGESIEDIRETLLRMLDCLDKEVIVCEEENSGY